jgi:hypothetical protein
VLVDEEEKSARLLKEAKVQQNSVC